MSRKKSLLTGAQVVAMILKQAKVKNIFAYPGTSELALCDIILKTPGLNLVNSRGDKEAVFMAAGSCLMTPAKAVAILHGARGLTNAAGAIADANRNEIGTVIFVGLPSTRSSSFLPPHGERNLIKSIGNFVKASEEITAMKARDFVKKVKRTILQAQVLPLGPTLIGLPQDILEQRWIPPEVLAADCNIQAPHRAMNDKIRGVCRLLQEKKHPLIIIDDFLFKNQKAKRQLSLLANSITAPVLQLHYRRGPMLFERISANQNPYFAGLYNPSSREHQKIMTEVDLLITIEDRNMYSRVIGPLPNCQKIALTSNSVMTKKNNYLGQADILIEGNAGEIMAQITERMSKSTKEKVAESLGKYCQDIRQKATVRTKTDPKFDFMRLIIAEELGKVFEKVDQPILVDDSQMFGGLLSEGYDKFPEKLRVFGDHGAFVGAGIAYSAGLAFSSDKYTVFCALGDQALTNGLQGLIPVMQENIKVIYLVCNNKESVSLIKQASSQGIQSFKKSLFLKNIPNFNYVAFAKTLGFSAYKVEFDPDDQKQKVMNLKKSFRRCLSKAISISGPVLIELELPSTPDAWLGIWATKGLEGN